MKAKSEKRRAFIGELLMMRGLDKTHGSCNQEWMQGWGAEISPQRTVF